MIAIRSQQESSINARIRLAYKDIEEGFRKWRVWLLLAWQDIRLRYRRSTLGPLWITLSMGVTIAMTGLLYGSLFHFRLTEYFPLFASGMLIWSWISIVLTESSNIFADAEHFLKQMKLPYSAFVLRTVARNFIIFLHNIVIFVPIIFIFHLHINYNTLWAFVGLLFILFNATTFGLMLAVLGTRYRDITQLIVSLNQVIFFLTPIMWVPSMLPEKYQFAIKLNPAAQFLEMVRNPLLGLPPSAYALSTTLTISIVGALFSFIIFARFRARIAYWL